MQNEKRKREKKLSMEQKEIYCSFLENNPLFFKRKHCDASVQVLWQELAETLNSTGGARHDKEKWKIVFDNWRYSVTHKLRLEKAELKKTGGGPASGKKITDKLEERAMACWGQIIVEGHSKVATAGYSMIEPKHDDLLELSNMLAESLEEPVELFSNASLNECVEKSAELFLNTATNDSVNKLDNSRSEPKAKRQRRSVSQRLDEDLNAVLEQSESNRQMQAESIVGRLDQLIGAVEKLAAAQIATANAVVKIAEALTQQTF